MTKFYKASSDIVFKTIFLKESNRDLLAKLIEESIGMEVEVLEVKASELPKRSVYEKGKILDVLVRSDIGEINIELNSYSDNTLRRRNASYIFARYSSSMPKNGDYHTMKNFYQINLTKRNSPSEIPVRSIYELLERDSKEKYIDNLVIYEYDISKIKNAWYNGDRTRGVMALLDATLEELSDMKGDIFMDKMNDEIKSVNSELEDVQFMDPDEDAEMIWNTILSSEKTKAHDEGVIEGRAEGKEEGIKEKEEEIAKKMKQSGFSTTDIVSITGLSQDIIEKL